MKEISVVQNKQARGFILKLLELTYPQPTASFTLGTALQENGYVVNPDITSHINYLADKGYVELKPMEMRSLQTTTVLVKLLPKGIDLLEGTINDPGVEI